MRTASSSSTSRIVGVDSASGSACCQDSPRYGDGPDHARRRRARAARSNGRSTGGSTGARCSCSTLPLLILAFSVTGRRPAGSAPAAQLRRRSDPAAGRRVLEPLPGPAARRPGLVSAAQWFRDQLGPDGLPARPTPGPSTCRASGAAAARISGPSRRQSSDAIVVMAHRDDTGAAGRERRRERHRRSGRARARLRTGGRPGPPARALRAHRSSFSRPTPVPSASARSASRGTSPFHVVATINLDAIAGPVPHRVVITGDSPAHRRRRSSRRPRSACSSRPAQRGAPGRFSTSWSTSASRSRSTSRGRSSPAASRRSPSRPAATGRRQRSATVPRTSTQRGSTGRRTGRRRSSIGSLDQGLDLAQGTTSFVWIGDRIIRGWAIELVLVALLIPYLVAVVDLFAHCRQPADRPTCRPTRACAPGPRSGSSSGSPSSVRARRRLAVRRAAAAESRSSRSGDWPVVALIALVLVGLLGWIVARQRLVPRRAVTADEQFAGSTAALLGLGVVSLLILATNPFALIFFTAPRCTRGSGCRRCRPSNAPRASGHLPDRARPAGPDRPLARPAIRPRLRRAVVPARARRPSATCICRRRRDHPVPEAACAAQLAVVAAGRYAPYPPPGQPPGAGAAAGARPPRGAQRARPQAPGRADRRWRSRAGRDSDRQVLDRCVVRQLSLAARNRHEGVRRSGPDDHVRVLAAHRLDQTASSSASQCRAHELVAGLLPSAPRPGEPGRQNGPGSRAPWSARSAGRTNSSKPTSDDTGFPGRPKTSEVPRTAKAIGLPGLTATRQKTSCAPS